jgi:hypothetical protein
MGADQILDVHEAWLAPGVYICRLENVAGAVDWGFSLYPTGVAYHAKSGAVPGGASWQGGPGQLEAFHVQIAQEGYYAFAAWKALSGDLGAAGSYRLVIHSGATDVPGAEPAAGRTAINSVRPNPFNPRATIHYGLARATRVKLTVYDQRGRLVRILVDGQQTAGEQAADWDGQDAQGRQTASGMYVIRLVTDEGTETRKVTLAK